MCRDSGEFKRALQIWLPLVQTKRETPRSIKRFGNRLRYLAMLQQGEELDKSRFDQAFHKVANWLLRGDKINVVTAGSPRLKDHQLVAQGQGRRVEPAQCTVGGVTGTVKPTAAGKDGAVTWVAATSGTPAKEWVAGATYAINDVIDTTDLLRLTTENGRIAIDTSGKTITLTVSAADTALMTWKRGEYDLEMVSSDLVPIVKSQFGEIGKASVGKEVTSNA